MTDAELIQENPSFHRKELEGEKELFTVRIKDEEKAWFEDAKRIIQQPKNSTALKQLARIGYEYVLHDEKIKVILTTVLENSRKNRRTGVTEGEYEI